MRINRQTAIMAGSMYLLLAAFIYAGYTIHADPARMDGLSPLAAAGPATRMASGLTASIGGVAAPWPAWATARDRENLERAMKTMRGGESRKLITTMLTIQDELEERGHGALELKGVVISHMAGDMIANSLTPLVLGALMTLALVWTSAVLSRAGLNPLDGVLKAAGYLVGVAGAVALRFFLAGALFLFFTGAGLWMRPFPQLLYGVTEVAAWSAMGLMALWLAALTGLANAPTPRLEKCGACKGQGYIPAKAPAPVTHEPIIMIQETGPGKPGEIKLD